MWYHVFATCLLELIVNLYCPSLYCDFASRMIANLYTVY